MRSASAKAAAPPSGKRMGSGEGVPRRVGLRPTLPGTEFTPRWRMRKPVPRQPEGRRRMRQARAAESEVAPDPHAACGVAGPTARRAERLPTPPPILNRFSSVRAEITPSDPPDIPAALGLCPSRRRFPLPVCGSHGTVGWRFVPMFTVSSQAFSEGPDGSLKRPRPKAKCRGGGPVLLFYCSRLSVNVYA